MIDSRGPLLVLPGIQTRLAGTHKLSSSMDVTTPKVIRLAL
jgi:hypothetical protein